MAVPTITPTGRERTFGRDELIVSKTDTKGIITYANRLFHELAGCEDTGLVGQNHNCIRHPEMPRCVFELLWATLREGREIFAYVVNLATNGDHYWVYAHVTPTFDDGGRIIGYHSNRRVPDRTAVAAIAPLYRELVEIERPFGSDRKGAIAASTRALTEKLAALGMSYDEFVWSLADHDGRKPQ